MGNVYFFEFEISTLSAHGCVDDSPSPEGKMMISIGIGSPNLKVLLLDLLTKKSISLAEKMLELFPKKKSAYLAEVTYLQENINQTFPE